MGGEFIDDGFVAVSPVTGSRILDRRGRLFLLSPAPRVLRTVVCPHPLRLSFMSGAAERILISADQIRERIHELAARIETDYPDGPLYVISVLKGAFIFVADLVRALKRPSVRIEFMGISSYANQKTSSGQVKVTRDLDVNIEGQHVLIVEDIIDSGVTLSYLKRLLEQRRPKSLAIATLLDKPEKRITPVDVKYIGFQIPDEFVVGYGLDYAEDYRNLSDIRVLIS